MSGNDIPEVVLWRGKDIREMDKAELIDVIRKLRKMHDDAQASLKRAWSFNASDPSNG